MVRVEVLAVGKELLIGRTLNTNAHWAGQRLARLGTMIKEITTVDDDMSEIAAAFKGITGRSPDFLVVIGGLGPTPDDMTLKGVAVALGVSLRNNGVALRMLKEHYARRGMADVELTPARLKMARLPSGAEPVMNEVGTAPGVRLVTGKTVVYCLPGVPSEMRSIFRDSVEPEVRAKLGRLHRKYVAMKLEGVLESALAPLLEGVLKRHPEAYVKSHPRGIREGISRIEVDIAVVGESKEETDEEGRAIAGEIERGVAGIGGKARPTRGAR